MTDPDHDEAVAEVAATVRRFYERSEPFRIFHGSSNSTRPPHTSCVVDISGLSRVLKVDSNLQVAYVEPNVPMDKLVQATLACGLLPPVVMEFPGITVGGGFAGSAGESSSYRYGYFDETVQAVEMVLANGQIVRASTSENSDLYEGAGGSLGTLGIVTKLEIGLVPAHRYLRLCYRPFSGAKPLIDAVRIATTDPQTDFVDAILFSPHRGVLMVGRMTDELPPRTTLRTFSRAKDPWFYMHTQATTPTRSTVEYMELTEYLFRYDRAAFWMGAEALKYWRFVPNDRISRWLLDNLMHTRMLFRAMHGGNFASSHVIQDLSLPYDSVEAFIKWCSANVGIWPLWLCPLRATAAPTFHPQTCDSDGVPQPMLNIGVWGKGPANAKDFFQLNRDLELRLAELGGRKVLYAQTYYTESEFWMLYDRAWYQKLRQRYAAESLPTVFDKVKTDLKGAGPQDQAHKMMHRLSTAWPIPGVRGIWYALRSKEHLTHQQKSRQRLHAVHKEE